MYRAGRGRGCEEREKRRKSVGEGRVGKRREDKVRK